jgi:hypothetical protein
VSDRGAEGLVWDRRLRHATGPVTAGHRVDQPAHEVAYCPPEPPARRSCPGGLVKGRPPRTPERPHPNRRRENARATPGNPWETAPCAHSRCSQVMANHAASADRMGRCQWQTSGRSATARAKVVSYGVGWREGGKQRDRLGSALRKRRARSRQQRNTRASTGLIGQGAWHARRTSPVDVRLLGQPANAGKGK